jgi:hypothetical protein
MTWRAGVHSWFNAPTAERCSGKITTSLKFYDWGFSAGIGRDRKVGWLI